MVLHHPRRKRPRTNLLRCTRKWLCSVVSRVRTSLSASWHSAQWRMTKEGCPSTGAWVGIAPQFFLCWVKGSEVETLGCTDCFGLARCTRELCREDPGPGICASVRGTDAVQNIFAVSIDAYAWRRVAQHCGQRCSLQLRIARDTGFSEFDAPCWATWPGVPRGNVEDVLLGCDYSNRSPT